MLHFYDVLPKVAADEARSIINSDESIGPVGAFLFCEHYGIERGCDCRWVVQRGGHAVTEKTVATINHSLESSPPPPGLWMKILAKRFSTRSTAVANSLLDDTRAVRRVRHYDMVDRGRRKPQASDVQEGCQDRQEAGAVCMSIQDHRKALCPCGGEQKYKRRCGQPIPTAR